MPSVVVVGSLNLDVVMRVERLPRPGETVLAARHFTNPGGKGANQAVAAARLGNDVHMVGAVGDDDAGTSLVGALDTAGVDTRFVHTVAGASSGMATIAVDATGENCIVVGQGANGLFGVPDVDASRDVIRDADALLLQLEVSVDAVARAAELARGLVIVNPAPAQSLPSGLLENTDVLVPNETELEVLAGRTGDVRALAAAIAGPDDVVVTLGSQGAYVRSADVIVPAVAVDVVDTTAAGDAFCGAVADALTRRDDIVAATEWAVAVAALTVTREGAQQSLPTQAEVAEFVAR